MNQLEGEQCRSWPPRGPVWVYRGAGWVQGELIRVEKGGISAIVCYAKAGSRDATNQACYDPRNVRMAKPKKGESYL